MTSVRRAFAWSIVGQAVSIVALLAATVVLAHLLTPHEMGVYAAGVAVNGILQVLAAFGLATYITREEHLTRHDLAATFTINALLSLALAGATLLASYALAATFDDPGVGRVLRLLAIVPLISIVEFLPAALLQRTMNFKPLSIVLTLRSFASTAVTIGSVLLGASYMSAAYGALAYAIVGAIGANVALPGHLHIRWSLRGWRRITSFGLRVMSIGGFSVLSVRAAEIAMARILGLPALGIFSRASTIYNLVYANIFGTAARVLLVRLAEDNRRSGDLRATYMRGLDITLALMWPILLGIATLSSPIIARMFGDRWLAAAAPLAILMGGQALSMTFAMSYELFVLRDELARQTRYELFRSIGGFALFVVGCSFGLQGAALGRVGEVLLGAMIYIPSITRLARVGWRELVECYARNMIICAAAIGPATIIMTTIGWSPKAPLTVLAGCILGGVLSWLVALRLTRHVFFAEIAQWRTIVRTRLHRRDATT